MTRRVVTTRFQAAGQAEGAGANVDTYFDRVIKYIPADIIAAWTAVTGIIASQTVMPTEGTTAGSGQLVALWISFGVGVILTFLWVQRQTTLPNQPPARTQSIVSTLAFIVWVFALGGPFATLGFYEPWIGSLLLIGFTLAVGLVVPSES
jgi:hypothetical protein